MGVNLVPIVRNFTISTETFAAGDHSVQDGCVTVGTHRLMRFDFLTHNVGNTDLVVGSPAARPDLFVWSAAHGHYHLKDFNEFTLYDAQGNQATQGHKQAFCLIDVEKMDPNAGPAKFTDCNSNQGVSAGWADLYNSGLACQFIVIDGVPDGDYTLVSTTNRNHIVAEDTYDDNTICTGLRIAGNGVTVIPPPIYIESPNQTINFNDIPEGEKTVRAAVFKVRACPSVTFTVTGGPSVILGSPGTKFELPLGATDILPEAHTLDERVARIWISYTGTVPGDVASGTVTIHCNETNQNYTFNITANTVARPTVGVVLVLDKSGSMNDDAGDGRKRIDVLHDSAPPFVDLIQEHNGVGIVSFDHNVTDVMSIQAVGPASPFDPVRVAAKAAISNHQTNINGMTAIGSAVEHAHNLLASVTGYAQKAMIVLTDGQETAPKYISQVQSSITDRVFAIGLGTLQEINPVALTQLTNGTGGYIVMTGTLNQDDYFVLSKYYLQILAGVTNQQIVVDPDGQMLPGQVARIPFRLNEADISSDVILLSPAPQVFQFALETPTGQVIDPSMVVMVPGMSFVPSNRTAYYRMTLPAVVGGNIMREGIWHALLTIDKRFGGYAGLLDTHVALSHNVQTHGIRYSLSVHSYSNLRMRAALTQTGYEPGATLTVRAMLTEYDLPVEQRAIVTAEIERPDQTKAALALTEVEPGVFEASIVATMAGIYFFHIFGHGRTLRGRVFTREQWLTGVAWKGGDNPPPTEQDDPKGHDQSLCMLFECLLSRRVISFELEQELQRRGINLESLRRCMDAYCKEKRHRPTAAEAQPDAGRTRHPEILTFLRNLISEAEKGT
jgi:hypothetical protein